jgi:hypothetical protein
MSFQLSTDQQAAVAELEKKIADLENAVRAARLAHAASTPQTLNSTRTDLERAQAALSAYQGVEWRFETAQGKCVLVRNEPERDPRDPGMSEAAR